MKWFVGAATPGRLYKMIVDQRFYSRGALVAPAPLHQIFDVTRYYGEKRSADGLSALRFMISFSTLHFAFYRCSTLSRISWVRPWFQYWVPM